MTQPMRGRPIRANYLHGRGYYHAVGQSQSGRFRKRSATIMPTNTIAKHNMVIVKLSMDRRNSAWPGRAIGYSDRLIPAEI